MIQTNIKNLRNHDYHGNLKKAVTYLTENYSQIQVQDLGEYKVDPAFFYLIQEYQSKDTTPWESHKKYIDIQVILVGEEVMDVSNIKYLQQIGEYDETKDWFNYEGEALGSVIVREGDLVIFFPEDGHQPGLKTKKGNMLVKKALFKVLI